MHGRALLQTLISDFSIDNLKNFFRNTNESFTPANDDYSRFKDDTHLNLSQIQRIGEIDFNDAERLIIIAAKNEKELTTKTGKKQQYELARKILKAEYFDAGIFVFYDETGHFRFSLVVATYSGTSRKFSNFRRYTFFVSPDLPNKTFLNQIGRAEFSSIEDILEAFSLEAVSDEFYNSFKPLFDEISFAVQDGKQLIEVKQDFALLFAIRIIFLGFVQKKGWLGKNERFLQDFWKEYQSQFAGNNTFYSEWLVPLFFEALNSPPGRKVKYQNNDFSSETESILQMAPYLNGELFKEKNGVDNLELWIPDAIIEKFFEFLFQYNFTIEENKLYDEELELNPEFLGIIFENLVVKVDGAVYTPRTEVDFMCRIALVKWLEKNSSAEIKDLYELFFREQGLESDYDEHQKQGDFTTAHIRELIQRIQNITICDPAAGSGAFEVGMLHVLNEIMCNLQTRNNAPADLEKKTAYEQKKDIIGTSLYGVEVKHWAVWINQLRLWLTLFIDMPDEYKNSIEPLLPSLNFKIRRGDSLVQRIGSKMFPVQEHAHIKPELKRKITELKKLKVDFFNNRSTNAAFVKQQENNLFKEILNGEIDDKQNQLQGPVQQHGTQAGMFGIQDKTGQKVLQLSKTNREKLQMEIAELEEQKRNLKDEHPLIWNIEFTEIFFERGGFDIIIGNPPYVRQEDIADPNGNLIPKDYKAALQEMVRMDFPKHFFADMKIDGKSDLYTYFYIRSLHLLNPKGMHVFICSNSWLDVGYGAWLQYFLLKNVPIHFIVDNHARRSFANADINTIISVLGAPAPNRQAEPVETLTKFIAFKKPFEESILTENLLEIEKAQSVLKQDAFRVYPITQKELLEEGSEKENELDTGTYVGDKWGGKYLRAPDIFFTILEKGKGKFVKLKDIADVKRGITTGANDFFYLTPLGPGSKQGLIRVQNAADWVGDIEEEFLKPVIKSPQDCLKIILSKDDFNLFVFMCSKSKRELNGTGALKYIQWAEGIEIRIKQGSDKGKMIIGFHNIESVRNRNKWYDLGIHKFPSLVWQKSVNDRHIQSALNFESFVDQRLYEIISVIDSNKLAVLLNSTVFFIFKELYGRANLGEGVLDTAVFESKQIRVINPELIKSINEIEIFYRDAKSIFSECSIEPNSKIPISEQEPKPLPDRAELDKVVFDVLGLTEEERKEVYRAVCQLVWNRISKAGSVKKRR